MTWFMLIASSEETTERVRLFVRQGAVKFRGSAPWKILPPFLPLCVYLSIKHWILFYYFNQQCSISLIYFTDLCILFPRLVLCTLKGCLYNNMWPGHEELINYLRKRKKPPKKLIHDRPVPCFPGEKDKRCTLKWSCRWCNQRVQERQNGNWLHQRLHSINGLSTERIKAFKKNKNIDCHVCVRERERGRNCFSFSDV